MCNKLKIALVFIGFCSLFLLSGQTDGKKLIEQKLSWAEVSGAWGYEVVIRSGEKEIIREQINQSEYTFSLAPGEYEFAIVVLNKFKKAVSMTSWQPLIIKEALQPVVRRFTPEEVYQNQGEELTIKAEVYQAREETSFFLLDSSGGAIEGRITELNAESVTLVFPLKDMAPGVYTLKAEDSSGLSDISEINTLRVLEVFEPEIRSVSEKRLVQEEVYEELIIKGSGFNQGFSAFIRMGDQIIMPYEAERLSEDQVRLAVIIGFAPPGRYDLEIVNPSGLRTVKQNAFIIEEAPLTQIIREVPREDSFSILGGYDFAVNVQADFGEYGEKPFGIGMKIRQDLANRVFWRIPGLRPLGIELDTDWTTMHYRNADYDYDQFYLGMHFYYTIPLLRDWYILPSAGMGMANLLVKREGETLQGELAAALTVSAGALKEFKNGALLEFGLDYRLSFYTGSTLGNLHPWVMGGYRL